MKPLAAAALCFVDVAVLGYALHRLGFHLAGEPDPRLIVASTHIGYYWRVSTALWWGSIAAAAGWRFPALGAWAERALLPCVGIATLIAFVVP